jgi:hypothetical protein
MDRAHITPADLRLEPGIGWAGTFVKHGEYRGRRLSFQIPIQLVINCLPPVPGAIGPMQTVLAHESAIEAACRSTLLRLDHTGSTIVLRPEDLPPQRPDATDSALAA